MFPHKAHQTPHALTFFQVDPSGALSFYGDADGSFTEFMGCGVDLKVAGLGPGKRSNRYSMLVEDPSPDRKPKEGPSHTNAVWLELQP